MNKPVHNDIRLYRITRATILARSTQLTPAVIVAFNSEITGGLTGLLARRSLGR